MKTLLAKFYKSLACRVAWALLATTSVANAHDLPLHFPFPPTDWGMVQQDCMGFHENQDKFVVDLAACSNEKATEFSVAQPDIGNPPEPQDVREQDVRDQVVREQVVREQDVRDQDVREQVVRDQEARDRVASHELIGPSLYDGADCAQLESFYRNASSDQLVEFKPAETAQIAATQSPTTKGEFEFHKSFFAACSCDFENRQANQSIIPPKFTLQRTFIEDHFANEFTKFKPLVLRNLNRSLFTANSTEPLAIAIPTKPIQNKHILADALSQLANYDCIARSEFYSCHRAFQFGELAGSSARSWFADALPSVSHMIADFAPNLKPAKKSIASAPMFVIYTNSAGNEIAIPIAQAREWEQPAIEAPIVEKVAVSQEMQDLVDSVNTRLQWAGGRLSAAANYMNDWFSDRFARSKSNDLR